MSEAGSKCVYDNVGIVSTVMNRLNHMSDIGYIRSHLEHLLGESSRLFSSECWFFSDAYSL